MMPMASPACLLRAMLLAAAGIATLALAQHSPPTAGQTEGRPGPWDADVAVVRVDARGGSERLALFPRAGVPTVARLMDGRLIAAFQHFPDDDQRNFDRVAVSFSRDEGRSWEQPRPVVVSGMETGLARPFDPTLVPLPDGRVRLYFTSNRSSDFRRSVPAIFSAVSRDGVDYEFEPGVRFAVEERVVIDCAVALHEGIFHMIVPDNGSAEEMTRAMRQGQPPSTRAYHAVSRDGLRFERVADLDLPMRGRWLGNMQSVDGSLVFFGTGPGPWPLVSDDGSRWRSGQSVQRIPGADPGAVRLRDGGWLLLVTTPPRPGTPSDARRPRPQGVPGR